VKADVQVERGSGVPCAACGEAIDGMAYDGMHDGCYEDAKLAAVHGAPLIFGICEDHELQRVLSFLDKQIADHRHIYGADSLTLKAIWGMLAAKEHRK
jgi:hypothetical protein